MRPTLWISSVKLPRHHILPKSWHISILSLLGYPKFVPKTRPGRHKAVALLGPAWQVLMASKSHSENCKNYRFYRWCHIKTSLKIIKHHQTLKITNESALQKWRLRDAQLSPMAPGDYGPMGRLWDREFTKKIET